MDILLEAIQKQIICPKMTLSLSLLKMDDIELASYIQDAAEQNPVLDISSCEFKENEVALLAQNFEGYRSYDVLREEIFYSRNTEDYSKEELAIQPTGNLLSYIENQIGEIRLRPMQKKLVYVLLSYLNESGYIEADFEELKNKGYSPAGLKEALAVIQSLEPPGIGARNLSECLCLQLKRMKMLNRTRKELICHYLFQICRGKEKETAKKLGISVQLLKSEYALIQKLNPKPGLSLEADGNMKYILPDIIICSKNGELQIDYNTYIPKLTINQTYLKMLKSTQDSLVSEYIGNHLKNAQWIMECIQKRRKTICSIAEALLKLQRPFFLYGENSLIPMNLTDVAREANVHESTVCRAINGKYLLCDYGLYEIKKLFKGAKGKDPGKCMDNIKTAIKNLVDKENGEKPLSDQKITELLHQRGIDISRRVVNKYREQMNILPSRMRYK